MGPNDLEETYWKCLKVSSVDNGLSYRSKYQSPTTLATVVFSMFCKMAEVQKYTRKKKITAI
jgi:hypothetical protein